jgi:hypothetical protein
MSRVRELAALAGYFLELLSFSPPCQSFYAFRHARRTVSLYRTNYGRSSGWFVEDGGRRVAELHHVESVEMFWEEYRIVPLTTDPSERTALFETAFWEPREELRFRNRESGELASLAFSAIAGPDPVRQTIAMRALYILPTNRPAF